MKRTWKIVGIATVVAILGLAAVGAVALAQEPEDGADSPFKLRDRFRVAIAGALGIDVEKYDAAVEEARGKVLDDAVEEGVLTEEQVERQQERAELGYGRGMMPHGDPGFRGRRGGRMPGHGRGGFMGGPGNSLVALAAENLGMDVDDLLAELQAGKTVAGVDGLGGDAEAIAEAYVETMAGHLEEAVADGRITAEQAASMQEQMKEAIQKWLKEPRPAEESECPGGHWRRAPGQAPGRFWGFPGQNDA
ncbi:hypothetical protein ACFLTC_00515 [Chloroflexota bacterium]